MASEAFRQELTKHIGDITRFAYSMSRSSEIAEELVNDTVCAAIDLADGYTLGTNMPAWLYRIQVGIYRNMMRRRRTRNRLEIDADDADVAYPAAQHDRAELADAIRIIDTFPEEQAKALLLVAHEGRSYAEAADILGCRLGTVQSRVSRARSALARAMDEDSMDVLASPD